MTDELLIKFLLKEASEEESITVQEWVAADPANNTYYAQFEKVWQAGKNLAAGSKVDVDEAWARFKNKTPANIIVKPMQQKFRWLKIAAVLVVAAGAWMAYSLFISTGYKDLIAVNQVITKHLPDGSELTLNKNSEISYSANFKNHRNVKLTRGDVFFSVAHDKSKPFVIDINNVSVTVVGTSFNIKASQGETEIIVETGIVRVNLNGEEVELHKGEKVLIKDTSANLTKEQTTDQLYNYYRSKKFIASNTPLSKLVDVLNEAYGAKIVIVDPSLAEEKITTTLEQEKGLDENLRTIYETLSFLDLKIERNQGQVLLSKTKR